MNFKTINIIKHPIDRVWTAMRDHLLDIVDLMEDIDSVTVELYEKKPDVCNVVNIWKASPKLPQTIAVRVVPEMFVWTDRAQWFEKNRECQWRIEPHYFRDKIQCSGSTKFDPAMGGRGTRITLSGNIQWSSENLPEVQGLLEGAVLKGAEALVKNLIPKNFRKLTDALQKHLDTHPND